MITSDDKETWNVESARHHYNIERWGAGYFNINAEGNATARPLKDQGAEVDITEIIREAKERDLHFPLLIRFQDILHQQVVTSCAGSDKVNGWEGSAVTQLTVELQFHVTGTLEFLKDHLVHFRAGLSKCGSNDGQ